MRALMRRLGAMGKTIIVSSHILPELADVCNKVGIIDSGVLIANDDVQSIIKKVRPNTVLLIEPAIKSQFDAAAKLIEGIDLVSSIAEENNMLRVTLKIGVEDYSSIATTMISQGITLKKFSEEEINLESAFMAFTKGAGSKI
jgi:ABC-2 type transport system ATP-binding protein